MKEGKIKVLVLNTDGEIKEQELNGQTFNDEIHEIISGYYENVSPGFYGVALPKDFVMMVNEDGLALNLPFNLLATVIYNLNMQDPIVGNVVFVKIGYVPTDEGYSERDYVDCSAEELMELEKLLKFIKRKLIKK